MTYRELLNQIYEQKNELNALLSSFWNQYSNFETWQFWVLLATIILPLILLYFTVDRKRIFELFFYGYTVHIFWTYIDIVLERYNLFNHTYLLLPAFPFAVNITTSLLPVGFLLVYQYCTNHQKNFYLYTLILSAIYSLLAILENHIGFSEYNKGMNVFYIFLIDLGITYLSYWFTRTVKHYMQKTLD